MSDRKPGPVLPIVVTVAVLLAGYVGAYYATMTPMNLWHDDHGRLTPKPELLWKFGISGWYAKEPVYRFSPRFAAPFFAPMHSIDRLLRPDVWNL